MSLLRCASGGGLTLTVTVSGDIGKETDCKDPGQVMKIMTGANCIKNCQWLAQKVVMRDTCA